MDELIKLLKSKRITDSILDMYRTYKGEVLVDVSDKEMVSYIKSLIIDEYMNGSEEIKKCNMDLLSVGFIDNRFVYTAIRHINASKAKVNDQITPVPVKSLLSYIGKSKESIKDPIYESLSKYNKQICNSICSAKEINIVPITKVESGDYSLPLFYKLDDEEINKIRQAGILKKLIFSVHSLYDEEQGELGKTKCNYNLIQNEVIRRLVPHTNKRNPEINVLLEDGTIVNYFNGDIRVKPYNMSELIMLVKLAYTSHYHRGLLIDPKEMEEALYLLSHGEIDFNFDMTDDEVFSENIRLIAYTIYRLIDDMDQIYSKRMIEQANEEITRSNELALKYEL